MWPLCSVYRLLNTVHLRYVLEYTRAQMMSYSLHSSNLEDNGERLDVHYTCSTVLANSTIEKSNLNFFTRTPGRIGMLRLFY